MVLAVRELERGDGDWENIQDVLRSAFLAHDRQLTAHQKRLGGCDQRAADLIARCDENERQTARFVAHVDALARTVNTLSEELKQRAHEEEDQRKQSARWMESMTRTVEAQLQALHARISGVENGAMMSSQNLERRLELMEEELGHVVNALEKKTDMSAFKANKLMVEEALKQRCRKTAFDKEVARVQQLVRSHHSTVLERVDSLKVELTDQIDQDLRKHEERIVNNRSGADSDTVHDEIERIEDQCGKLKKELDETIASTRNEWTSRHAEFESQTKRLVADSHKSVTNSLGGFVRVDDMDQRVAGITSTIDTLRLQLASMLEEYDARLVLVDDRQSQTAAELTRALTELKAETGTKEATLDKQLEQLQQAIDTANANLTKHQATSTEELRATQDATKAKDKKTHQQMHVVADKLRELDQILKLVGKQLVQNTSQLQLMWTEHSESSSLLDASDPLKLLDSDRFVEESSLPREPERSPSPRHSQHQQLQEAIQTKLSDYQAVLQTDGGRQAPHVADLEG